TAVIIPGENNHSRCPGRAIHHRIDLLYRPVLSRTDRTVPSTMFVQWAWWHKPAKGGECIVCRVACKLLPGHIICPRGPVSVLAESVQAIPVIACIPLLRRIELPRSACLRKFIRKRGDIEAWILPRPIVQFHR